MCAHVQTVVVQIRKFQTQVDRKLTPVHTVRREVISTVDGEVIDEADHLERLFACRVFCVHDLHLQVVRKTEIERRRHPSRHSPIGHAFET